MHQEKTWSLRFKEPKVNTRQNFEGGVQMNSTKENKVMALPGLSALKAVRSSLCWPRDTLLPLEVIRPVTEEDASKEEAA